MTDSPIQRRFLDPLTYNISVSMHFHMKMVVASIAAVVRTTGFIVPYAVSQMRSGRYVFEIDGPFIIRHCSNFAYPRQPADSGIGPSGLTFISIAPVADGVGGINALLVANVH
ncbi:hypothetical protein F4776DRAFT_363906 [Hypoxylon sp. NC0597]|nr:hypothetical protein F4776DRAFT_363906 [Hypoxylon sp. NC0597]